jgi:hypothetical protein
MLNNILKRIDKSIKDWNPFTSPESVSKEISDELTKLARNDRETYNEVFGYCSLHN